nr:hypothetical protein [uncultured archaeon]
MLIRILKECKVRPKGKEEKVRVQPGQIVDLPEGQGKSVINAEYGEEAETEEVPDMTETGEVEELGELEEEEEAEEEPEITDAQRKRFFSLADEVFGSDGERKDWLREEFGTDSVRDLGHGQMNSAIAKLDKEAGEVTYSSEKEATGARQALKQVDEEMEKQREVSVPTVLDPDMIKEYTEKVEELIEKVIDMRPHQKGGDIYYINDEGKPTTDIGRAVNTYIGRSGLRKLALACNLEVEPVRKERLDHEDYYTWVYEVQVKMPNGRTYTQEGACSSNEAFFASGKGQVEEKDIVHTAETRAMNRAIMDVIGAPNIGREQWAED